MRRSTKLLLATAAFVGAAAVVPAAFYEVGRHGSEPQTADGQPAAPTQSKKAAPAPKPPAISVVSAERRELAETVMVTGTLLPREEVVVGVDIEGLRIMALEVDQGDTIKAGQTIARLDDSTIQTQLAQNASSLARSDAAIAQARSAIAEAEATKVEAAQQLDRARTLKDKGVTSQDVLDQRTAAFKAAEARVSASNEALRVSEADRKVIEAQRREVEIRLSRTTVKAPTDGIVLVRNAKIGAIASGAGEPLFRLARDGKIELDAEIPETTLGRLRDGMSVKVTPPGSAGAIEGKIRLVAPQVDQATRLGHVRVALPADERLRVGSYARGLVELARREVVAVPLSAVFTEKSGSVVQVVKDGKVETRKVDTGLTGGGRVEIAKGVAAGEAVVVKAGTFVREGDMVAPVMAKAEEVEG